MIEYPYIPPVTGEAAEKVLEMIEKNNNRRETEVKAPKKERESLFRMFRNAGILV